jgi:hypothetical protein
MSENGNPRPQPPGHPASRRLDLPSSAGRTSSKLGPRGHPCASLAWAPASRQR